MVLLNISKRLIHVIGIDYLAKGFYESSINLMFMVEIICILYILNNNMDIPYSTQLTQR